MEEIQELFNSLESINPEAAEEAKKKFRELFNSTKESWLLNGMFDYYLNCGSERSIDVLISVREPHDRYLFDRLSDTVRGANRLSGLTLLGHVVRRHPSWIYKIASHSVFKDLIRILKSEKDVVILMSALLIVVILLPIIASLIAPYLQDLFEIFSHLAIWKTNNPHKVPEGYLLHVEIGMYALFNRLYGMFPCNFLFYLRQHYSSKESLTVFTHTVKPMLDTVRIHPLLVTASKDLEVSANRWKKIEANDVILECAKVTIEGNYDKLREDCHFRRSSSNQSRPPFSSSSCLSFESKLTTDGYVELGNHGVPVVASYSVNLPEPAEIWSPALEIGAITPPGASSIPHTPVIQGCVISAYTPQEGNSPPEAAIEATPESTPIKDVHEHGERAHSASGSSVVRCLNTFHSQPSSPLRKEHTTLKLSSTPTGLQRVHRVISERNQNDNLPAKVKGPYSPGSPLRVIPQVDRGGRPHTPGDRSDEDREVETAMTTSPTSSSKQVKREDSILGESSSVGMSDGVEWREWKEGGSLRLPECRSVNHFARRLRCYSQCQPETLQLLSIGFSCGNSPKEAKKSFLRRTASCPDLSRTSKISSNESHNEVLSQKNDLMEKTFMTSGTQTDTLQPLIYEHLLLSVLSPLEPIQQHSAPPDVTSPPLFRDDLPKGVLDLYLDAIMKQIKEKQTLGVDYNSEVKQLRDQLTLLTLQLQFEKHRREVHAERNRRLLGRYRENRVLEEHNYALRDQVQLLHQEIEMLHKELIRIRQEAKEEEQQQLRSIAFWEKQNAVQHSQLKEATETIKHLKEDLKEERRKKETIAKGYSGLESEVFELRIMKNDAIRALQRADEMKVELAMLQHHLISAGELELRLKSWIDDLLLTSNKSAEAKMQLNAYEKTVSDLRKKLDDSTMKIEGANIKLKEAQELCAKRELLVAAQERFMEDIRKDCEQQIKESEDTCVKLREINTEREVEMLKLQAQVGCLEEKLRLLSMGKPVRKLSPSFSDISGLHSGNFTITDETIPLQNLQLLVEQSEMEEATSSRDLNHPP